MSRSKINFWLSDEGLLLLKGWSGDGLSMEEISREMNISKSTLLRWRKGYPQIEEAIFQRKNIQDYAVEKALYEKAISGSVTAQIFWLKSRRQEKWPDKTPKGRMQEQSGGVSGESPFSRAPTEALRRFVLEAEETGMYSDES